ncbi:unnamed protein product [Protopolystoma xenopodis]|uniref:Uncharacterized protein n=1 Tax=Protopolystoma xenopodis TaxID=117903 RepID=A0A448WT31_9PLAT|nr:unnamed protein product [Protopolystoma xenopodis]
MFVILYDLADMPANCKTFLRQRTVYMPILLTSAATTDPLDQTSMVKPDPEISEAQCPTSVSEETSQMSPKLWSYAREIHPSNCSNTAQINSHAPTIPTTDVLDNGSNKDESSTHLAIAELETNQGPQGALAGVSHPLSDPVEAICVDSLSTKNLAAPSTATNSLNETFPSAKVTSATLMLHNESSKAWSMRRMSDLPINSQYHFPSASPLPPPSTSSTDTLSNTTTASSALPSSRLVPAHPLTRQASLRVCKATPTLITGCWAPIVGTSMSATGGLGRSEFPAYLRYLVHLR